MGGAVTSDKTVDADRGGAEATPSVQPAAPRTGSLPRALVKRTHAWPRSELLSKAPPGPRGSALQHPQWLELHLELETDNLDWFEGSISPWAQVDRPEVDWDPEVREMLGLADLNAPDAVQGTPSDKTRALALLPHLYSLGVNRVAQELQLGASSKPHIQLFTLVGFVPVPGGEELSFRTLRTNVAVLGEVIVTIRLPDLTCPPDDEPKATASGELLGVPPRFFPDWAASAVEVAEEVARQQAATTRALSDVVRDNLQALLDDAKKRSEEMHALTGEARLHEEKDLLGGFTRLTRIAEMVDRQLARLLRRLGSYGEDGTNHEATDIRRRYEYALDEVRSLGREVVSARDRHLARTDAERQADREQFQFIAAVVGSAILIPTLVAGIFGANVWVPGERDTHGFGALLLFIVAFATGGSWLIDRAWKRRWRLPPGLRPWVGAVAVVALLGGIGLLFLAAV